MNNKELTEKIKKDITGILEEKSDLKLATSYYDSRVEGINAIADYITKTTQSNDEIKREVVENFKDWVINRQTEDGYKYKMWYEYIEEYLTKGKQ